MTRKRPSRQRSIFNERLALLGFTTYQEYLASPHWRAFSARVRKTHCERPGCGARSRLQVHHVTYARLGAEIPSDVRTLCSRCHKLLHHAKKGLDPARLPPARGPSDAPGRRKKREPRYKRQAKRTRFDYRNALAVVCPICGSQRSVRCVDGTGSKRRTHKERTAFALSKADPETKRIAQKLKDDADKRRAS